MNPEIAEKLKRLDALRIRAGHLSSSLSRKGSTIPAAIAVDLAEMTNRVSMMLMDLEKRQGVSNQSEEHEGMLANMGHMIDGLESMLDSLQSFVDKNPAKKA